MRRRLLLAALIAACALPAAPLATAGAPFVEVLEPSGQPVRGVVIGIHGGAWYGVGREIALQVRDDLERWRARGWRGVIVDYPKGGDAVDSVLRAFDRVRARYGRDVPICLYGESAGGQLALVVAAERGADVACVETAGAPTDLGAIDASVGLRAAHADRNARMAFPGDALARFSPVRMAGAIRAPLLLTHLRTDPVIGVAHAYSMGAAVAGSRVVVLEPGRVGWVHGAVASLGPVERAEAALDARARAWRPGE
jgi:acetyl esterase/lipase